MLGMEGDDLGQSLGPVGLGLAGQTVHQIDADIVEACTAGILHGLLGLSIVMPAADKLEQVIVAGLNANGQTVNALLTQKFKGGETDGVGIALHSYFRVQTHIAVELQLIENFNDFVCAVKAGRAAAEVYGVHLILLDGVG